MTEHRFGGPWTEEKLARLGGKLAVKIAQDVLSR